MFGKRVSQTGVSIGAIPLSDFSRVEFSFDSGWRIDLLTAGF